MKLKAPLVMVHIHCFESEQSYWTQHEHSSTIAPFVWAPQKLPSCGCHLASTAPHSESQTWPVEHFITVAISAALHTLILATSCESGNCFTDRLASFYFLFWVGDDGYGGTDLISLITFHSKRNFTPVGNLDFSLLALLSVSANQMVPLSSVTSEIFITDHLAY